MTPQQKADAIRERRSGGLTTLMAKAIHPHFDEEDQAAAYAAQVGVVKWLRSSRAEELALLGVDRAMQENDGRLSYGETVRAVLAALAEEASR